ncbi:hypothetical protein NKR23_g1365 [Pleurostoma richardsiae]|uniref:Transcriptional coactivator p15 (PC4) C-terminal domain-containing protein n=1 Tax=Pleurostoma richardsiae TaxID=41990 RepID=A0AA38SB96_9PEZI|nr:hypothetical protein NKR23_g1365 [Pleurostoma richardsiae]
MPKYKSKRALSEEDDSEDLKSSKKIKPSDSVPASKSSSSKSSGAGAGKDSEGNSYWELSSKRRVGVSKFKNALLVNIREYYEADGELKPGKKGISLSVDQYQSLLKAIPAINAELRKAGHNVDDLNADSAQEVVSKPAKKAKKANIEATSDEESD